jgi:hypothetical protein
MNTKDPSNLFISVQDVSNSIRNPLTLTSASPTDFKLTNNQPTMPPFYPYTFTVSILPTTPTARPYPCHNSTALRFPSPSSPTGSVVIAATSPHPTPTLLISAEAGTSISTPAIIGIIAALLFLFGGMAWFAFHALVTMPRRKREIVKERGRARRRAEKAARVHRERLGKVHRGSDGIFVV